MSTLPRAFPEVLPQFEPLEPRLLLEASFVIQVSVDGLRPDAITTLGQSEVPNFYRLMNEGSSTGNSRTDYDYTETLPNHTDIITARPVVGPYGHNVSFNSDNGSTVHASAGEYVTSVFDIVHDNGLRTGLYASKDKFIFFDRSWNEVNGRLDPIGADNGRDKIDVYQYTDNTTQLQSSFLSVMDADPFNYVLVHYRDPDSAGHTDGWMSNAYLNAVKSVDGFLGDIFNLIETNATLNGNTDVIVVADHGGTGTGHADAANPDCYTIPFYAWGPDVTTGGDLYTMNSLTRQDPGTSRPDYTADPQPIHHGDGANLATDLLGLGPLDGSFFNANQDLTTIVDETPPTAPADLAAVAASEWQIDLTWTAASDPESGISLYRIYRDNVLVGTSTDTTHSDTGLNPLTSYTYEVSAVNGGNVEGPRSSPVTEQTLADVTAPTLEAASAKTDTQVEVTFGEAVDPTTAETIGNYGIDNDITVSAAVLQPDGVTVLLATSTLSEDVTYTLTINNVEDLAGNPVAPGTQQTFSYVATGNGLNAQYYDNMDFTALTVTRVDPTINFDWGSGSPDPSVGADTFSVRWTGQVLPQYSETYTFYTLTDDGVRLWVNNQLIVDKWLDQSPTEWTGTIALSAGVQYDIQMEYYENGGGAAAQLSWSSPSQAKEIIPQSQLYAVVNDPPTALDDAYALDEDSTFSVDAAGGVLANDDDPDGDPMTAILVGDVSSGSLTLNPDGSFQYTPDPDFFGGDSFTYKANDTHGDSNTATVTLTVTGLPDAPVAANDAYEVVQDTTLVVDAAGGVLANDTDADDDTLSAILVAGVTHGTLNLNPDGSFDYTPSGGYVGPDSFTYRANDGGLDSNVATVSIDVTEVNDPPTAFDDAYEANEDILLSVPALTGVLANDTDPEEDPLSAVLVSDVSHGTLFLNADGSFDYTPETDYFGPDSFTYKANDGELDSNTATVNLTATSVNDAPVAADDAYQTDQDTTLVVDAATGVLANDTDVETDPLSAILVTDVSNGTLSLAADGSFQYTADPGYAGTDSFTYKANDTLLDSNEATVTINVTAGELVFYAIGESTALGTVSGDLTLTQESDNVYEALTEILDGKKSLLEHTWTFALTGGDTITFAVEAWHDGTEDDFTFRYSTDGVLWTAMVTVTKTADDGVAQTYAMPAGLSGTVYVQAIDTNRAANKKTLDTLYVDAMWVTSVGGGPQVPTANVEVTDASAAEEGTDPGTFTLTRTDTSGDLTVFYTVTGTATGGEDYVALSGSVTILDGAASADVTVTPIEDALEEGNETVVLMITDAPAYNVGALGSGTVTILDNDLVVVDDYAISESTAMGTVTSGDYTSTFVSDNSYEAITEVLDGKKSYLEHTWTFDVTGGSSPTFCVEAWHDGTEDDFTFAYSTDGVTWVNMLTVTQTSDDDALRTFDLPSAISGTVYVRVVDTNRAANKTALDTLYVDEMFIRCA